MVEVSGQEKQERHLLEILRDIKGLGLAPTIGNEGAVFIMRSELATMWVERSPMTGRPRSRFKITANGLSLLEHLELKYGEAK